MSTSITRKRAKNVNLLEYASKNREEGFFNDLTIIAGNENIPANRLILSCHSKYFEGMFKSILRHESVIEIKSVDGATMIALINFIYNGSITINDQNAVKLLLGAGYLDLDEVKQLCIEFLQPKIDPDNSLDIFKAAAMYKNSVLLNKALKFISTNLDEVAQTDEFKSLSKEELLLCISNLDRSNVKEISVYQALITWTRHKQDERKNEFPELFSTVILEKMTLNFLEDSVLEEDLVKTSLVCQNHVLLTLRTLVKFKESHLVGLGGSSNLRKVAVVFSLFQKTGQDYADFDVGLDCHCSLKFNNRIYTIGGRLKRGDKLHATNEVVKINPKHKKSKWKTFPSMNEKRCLMGACVYRGTLYVAGGANNKQNSLASTEYYDPAQNEWKYASLLVQRKHGHALVCCEGCLYALGGWSDDEILSSVEKLNDLNGSWQNIQPMQTRRKWLAAVNCNGVVYAIGGQSGKERSTKLKTMEKYDSGKNQWIYVSSMNIARSSLAGCVLRDKIYVVGGIGADGSVVKEIECYDPIHDAWSIVGTTTEELHHHTLVAV